MRNRKKYTLHSREDNEAEVVTNSYTCGVRERTQMEKNLEKDDFKDGNRK